MEIAGLGPFTKDDRFDWYRSRPLPVGALGGKMCQILLEDYDDDLAKEDIHASVKNLLSVNQSITGGGVAHFSILHGMPISVRKTKTI
jgi:hypothetical protein